MESLTISTGNMSPRVPAANCCSEVSTTRYAVPQNVNIRIKGSERPPLGTGLACAGYVRREIKEFGPQKPFPASSSATAGENPILDVGARLQLL
jgi:hypothetical protein